MLMKIIKRSVIIFLFFPVLAMAAVPVWKIIPAESKLTFSGIQNGSPVSGEFKNFSGNIQFDPDQLNASKVDVTVDINSLSTSYSELTSTLMTAEWLNVQLFPKAEFVATQFSKTGDNQYTANGTLTIRDKSIPVTLLFKATPLKDNKVAVEGSTTFKRTAFGLGQGEWASTDEVKDDVQVNFKITAEK